MCARISGPDRDGNRDADKVVDSLVEGSYSSQMSPALKCLSFYKLLRKSPLGALTKSFIHSFSHPRVSLICVTLLYLE